ETGVTLVDVGASFAPGAGAELRADTDLIDKPIAVILTHNHGDH
ncbi:MAG: MBL fold metallo-hydrolase, partial [Flavobacteriales bacterium]